MLVGVSVPMYQHLLQMSNKTLESLSLVVIVVICIHLYTPGQKKWAKPKMAKYYAFVLTTKLWSENLQE